MLRASSIKQGKQVDLQGVLTPNETQIGVPAQAELVAFAEAAVRHEPAKLVQARETLFKHLGPEALVDAACIVGNFERMNRIADACGIALGELAAIGEFALDALDIEHYNSAANTLSSR